MAVMSADGSSKTWHITLKAALAISLFIITASIFWPARHFDFVRYDDPLYVTENQLVQQGLTLEGVRYAFTTGHASNWHPITWLSHMLDCELSKTEIERDGTFVKQYDPKIHHTHSLLLHACNAALVFFVLCSLFRGSLISCAFIAALFAIHPLRIESVVWISERKDLLSAFFGFLAIWCYASFTRDSAWWKYALIVMFFALSLMSKPMLVTLPFVLLLLDFFPLRRTKFSVTGALRFSATPSIPPAQENFTSIARLIVEKLPLLALSIASGIVTIIVQHAGGSIDATGKLSLGARLANAAVSYARYLGKTFWPADLAVLYPQQSWPSEIVWVSIAGIAALTILAISLARRFPSLIVGWLWFAGALVPVIGIVQVGAHSIADRYTYFPHIGLFMAIVFTALALFGRERAIILCIAGAGLLAALSYETRHALRHWQNSDSLYSQALRVTKDNWIIHTNMGVLHRERGERSEAEKHFLRAVEVNPNHADTQYHAATMHAGAGRVREALAALNRAVEIDPDMVPALNDLAWLLATQADPTLRDPQRALTLSQRACEIHGRDDAALLDTLAAAYAASGKYDQAIPAAKRALAQAHATRQPELAAQIQRHLASFETGQPVREGRP